MKEITHRLMSDLFKAIDDLNITPDEYWMGIAWLNDLGAAGQAGLISPGLGLDHFIDERLDAIDAAMGIGKPWLMFCNSLGTDLHMWDAQVAALSGHFRILRYDRRGHGRSTAPPAPYSLVDLGGDVIALLDALCIARTHFCGLSLGGLTGQWLALHAADRLDHIVLCATAPRIGTAESWHARAATVQADGLAGLVPATAERWFTPAFTAEQPGSSAASCNALPKHR